MNTAGDGPESGTSLVSIVVPCYVASTAQAALLDETLATVATQTDDRWELIVVDDGSPVRVEDIVARHGGVTVRQDNAGSAAARNNGIAHARGDHLLFLDADDHLLPTAIETGLRGLAAHPDCGFAVGPREEMTFEGEPVAWSVNPPPAETESYYSLLAFDWYIIPPSCALFRRTVVDAIGGFRDPWGADDLDFYLRAAWQFPAWCYQSPAVTRYRRYSSSSSRDGERMLRSMRVVYERQWPLVHGSAAAEHAWRRGHRQLTEIFLDCLSENVTDRMRLEDHEAASRSAQLLARESPERWQSLVATGNFPGLSGLSGMQGGPR